MKFVVEHRGVALKAVAEQVRKIGSEAEKIAVAELNARGGAMRKGMIPVLTAQTGLRPGTIDRFLKEQPAVTGRPVYRLKGSGGNVSLKYFKPRETASGVVASPWGKARLFPHTFRRAGFWPHRVVKPNWNGQVFLRTGGTTGNGHDEFEKQRSGLFIAKELTSGATREYFEGSAARIGADIVQQITKLLP